MLVGFSSVTYAVHSLLVVLDTSTRILAGCTLAITRYRVMAKVHPVPSNPGIAVIRVVGIHRFEGSKQGFERS